MRMSPDLCGDGGDGDDRWPPGFRFHPTDEELVLYYLKRKMCRKRIKLDIIAETDVYKWDPEELPGQSVLKTGDRQWFFFSPRDRKYPNGARSNRATRHGYWKATGKDRNVTCNSRTVGLKKTLVFYRGRAPNGERTDWVMHEYTLDEEELKRCQNFKDYYALYKVYKKSGPGPKNGEQYGAPFKEEEWADDEYLDVNDTVDSEVPAKELIDGTPVSEVPAKELIVVTPVSEVPAKELIVVTPVSEFPAKELIDVTPVGNEQVNGQAGSLLDDIEDFLRRFAEEPPLLQQQFNDFADLVPQVVGEEETHSALVEPSFGDVNIPEPVNVLSPSGLQYDEHAIFDFLQSATSKLQACEASATNNSEWVHRVGEDDFLEMDDFHVSKATFTNIEKPVENFQLFEEFEVLNELDLFHDANMFLHEMGHIDQGTVSHLYANAVGNGMVNQVDYNLQSHSVVTQEDYPMQPHAVGTQVDYQFQPHAVGADQVGYQFQPHAVGADQMNYQFQPHAVGADQMNYQMWMHEQRNVVTPSASNQGAVSLPTSGVIYESTDHLTEVNQNHNQNQNQNGQESSETSRLSSALWSFVESIPTTPASASENPLVNRALERMSSFSRVRLHAITNNVTADNGAAAVKRVGSNRGFLLLSGLGALLAILWVLMSTVGVLGRCISS